MYVQFPYSGVGPSAVSPRYIGVPVKEQKGFKKGARVRWWDSGVSKWHYATVLRAFDNNYLEVKYDRAGKRVVHLSKFELVD